MTHYNKMLKSKNKSELEHLLEVEKILGWNPCSEIYYSRDFFYCVILERIEQ